MRHPHIIGELDSTLHEVLGASHQLVVSAAAPGGQQNGVLNSSSAELTFELSTQGSGTRTNQVLVAAGFVSILVALLWLRRRGVGDPPKR
jgi:hypothetical protein